MKTKEELAALALQCYALDSAQEIVQFLATKRVFVNMVENIGNGEMGESYGYDEVPEIIQVDDEYNNTITLGWL